MWSARLVRSVACSSAKVNAVYNSRSNSFRSVQSGTFIRISDEVSSAVSHGLPVVALESAIITHGMPFPVNLKTALDVESIVRQHGAVPATVAVLNGLLCVGLNMLEIEQLASCKMPVVKVSKRDLTPALSQKLNGGTTVSSTMFAAKEAGISVFVTGGIGGVHRDVQTSMDISADLIELGRTSIAVVCAGIKSILDIGRTMEFLETQGVPVVTVGINKEFPSFYSQSSGFLSPYNVDSPFEAANLFVVHKLMSFTTGVLFAVPIPAASAVCHIQLDQCISLALQEARCLHITGKEVTPFLLKKVNELMDGKSLEANVALIKNNAAVGSQIACEISAINRKSKVKLLSNRDVVEKQALEKLPSSQRFDSPSSNSRVIVIGGINFDVTSSVKCASDLQVNTKTYPGRIHHSFGGVGRNIADCLSRLNSTPLFISVVGDDLLGQAFHSSSKHMDLSAVEVVEQSSTAAYSCILSASGELMYGIGDYECHQLIKPQLINKYEHEISTAELVCIDGNITPESMLLICDLCHKYGIPVWFEPTDVSHIWKLFETNAWQYLSYASPNVVELRRLSALFQSRANVAGDDLSEDLSFEKLIEECIRHVQILLPHIPNLIITLGKHGIIIARQSEASTPFPTRTLRSHKTDGMITLIHYPSIWPQLQHKQVLSVSGAGDCLAAGMMAEIARHQSPDIAVRTGLSAAALSLQCFSAVPESISSLVAASNAVFQQFVMKPTVIPF